MHITNQRNELINLEKARIYTVLLCIHCEKGCDTHPS